MGKRKRDHSEGGGAQPSYTKKKKGEILYKNEEDPLQWLNENPEQNKHIKYKKIVDDPNTSSNSRNNNRSKKRDEDLLAKLMKEEEEEAKPSSYDLLLKSVKPIAKSMSSKNAALLSSESEEEEEEEEEDEEGDLEEGDGDLEEGDLEEGEGEFEEQELDENEVNELEEGDLEEGDLEGDGELEEGEVAVDEEGEQEGEDEQPQEEGEEEGEMDFTERQETKEEEEEETELEYTGGEEGLEEISGDPMSSHFSRELPNHIQQATISKSTSNKSTKKSSTPKPVEIERKFSIVEKAPLFNSLGLTVSKSEEVSENILTLKKQVTDFKGKERLFANWKFKSNLERELFSLMNNYVDVLAPIVNSSNKESMMDSLTLHILNHLIKSRDTVQRNNIKLAKGALSVDGDQGFTRTRVLILCPFRNTALEFAESLLRVLPKSLKHDVFNLAKVEDQFQAETELDENKPEDYLETFAGNNDDSFRLTVSFTKKSLRFFTDYFNSDIIIASPLAMKLDTGTEGEKGFKFDFLSSIEIVAVWSADVILMQNWQHLLDVLKATNRMPRMSHDTDFSRLRPYFLESKSQYYRQMLVFSGYLSGEMNSLVSRENKNIAGCVKVRYQKYEGTLQLIIPKLRQLFFRIKGDSLSQTSEARFQYLTQQLLPAKHASTGALKHTALFIPSYFDYVRIREHLRKNDFVFAKLSEYTSESKSKRARIAFKKGDQEILLITERYHFFFRMKLRGIRNVIFYGPPQNAIFYSEIMNMIKETDSNTTLLFSKFDKMSLERIIGTTRADHLISSEKTTFLFTE